MHFAQDVNKIALDDQQTLALNELLLQLEDVKRTLHGVTSDNEVLRSEVSWRAIESNLPGSIVS